MLNIVYSEQDKTDRFNIPMSMYLFNNQDNGINRIARSDGTLNMVEMEDGTTNYRFSLTMTTTGNNERDKVISLLNMQPSNEYFLNAINIGENDSPMSKRMEEPRDFSGEKPIDFSGDRPEERFMEFSGEKAENLGNHPMNRKEDNQQRVELFVNNEYIGLYLLSYNPDIRIRPRNR